MAVCFNSTVSFSVLSRVVNTHHVAEFDLMPAKWNIWSSEGVKATQSIWGTYVKIGWNVIRAAALRLDRWHTLSPPLNYS